MKKENFLFTLFILAVLLIIVSMMMGVQYLAAMILNFEFTSDYGPLFLTLNLLAGFILLIPLSLLLETIVEYIGFADKGGFILSEVLQFGLFVFYMEWTIPKMNIVLFDSMYTAFIFYTLMYGFFFGLGKLGDLIKKEDEQTLHTGK